jgi:hypothetical protein
MAQTPAPPAAPAPQPSAPAPGGPPGRYSADGFWWWDGAGWRPAYSQDRLWHWNGQTWNPAAAPTKAATNTRLVIGLGVGVLVSLLVSVALVVVGVSSFSSTPIANVFSNPPAAASSPTPSSRP